MSSKRPREDEDVVDDANEDEDERIVLPSSSSRAAQKQGKECPYLDTIARQVRFMHQALPDHLENPSSWHASQQNLDFDFERCCSVSLSHVNVYACLVCGKFFQGRGLSTHAYTHSLETSHHMFMKLDNGKVFCLPDNYEVVDRSMADIQYQLDPKFTPREVAKLDVEVKWSRALDSSEYMPGLVGLNNMKANDYANVVIQILSRVQPIRDFFLEPDNYKSVSSSSLMIKRTGELIRKLWNTRNFKGQVSPHEFMQAVMLCSEKRFLIEKRSDPVEFFAWLLNILHHDLTGGKIKNKSVITQCFQGELEVVTEKGTGKGKALTATEDLVDRVPFFLLALDLPPAPLFKDALEKNIIPQVPIFQIMRKFDGVTVTDDIKLGRRRMRVLRLPQFLCLHMRRFLRNSFFTEKNPTIVNFPIKNLDLKDVIPLPGGDKDKGEGVASKYDLIANVVHEGKAEASQGSYRIHVHRKVEETWYEVSDLRVVDVLGPQVALSESYFQVYEIK